MLGEIADVNWGDTHTTKQSYSTTGFTAYSASGPDGLLPYADYDRTGIVLSAIGADCGRTWLAKGKWSCIKNTIRLFSKEADVDTEFLYWATRDSDYWPKRGSAQPFISQGDARACVVRFPTISEQRAIAGVLRPLDDRIELNRRMNETLEAMARALFESWFVNFDPVRAKMEGRDSGLPPEIADLFPDRLVESERGDIPDGWNKATLGDIGYLNPESWTNHNAPDHILYVDLTNTKWGYIDSVRTYSRENAPSRARRVLRQGDTIVGTVRPGNGSFALVGRDGLTGSTGFAVLRPRNTIDRDIIWCAATSADTLDRLTCLADGGAYPAVSPGSVLDTYIALPDVGTRRAFSSLAAPLLNRIQGNETRTHILGTLRDTLLPKLVSGEVRLPPTLVKRYGAHSATLPI